MKHRIAWLFAGIVAAYFHQPLTTSTFYFRDLYLLFYPKRLFLRAATAVGEFPLWDPMTHGGTPFAAAPSNFVFHPSNLLYAVLPVLVALNVVLVLHYLFCALAAYWLARDSGLPRAAAFVAGIAYAFCGYTLSTANLTPLLLALPWIPLTIGLAQRALRERRSLLPAAISAAMPLYCGAAEVAAMMFAIIAVWFLFHGDVPRRRAAGTIAFLLVGSAGLSLLQTLPATSVIEQSARGAGMPYTVFTQWSVAPQRLPELVIPRYFGDTDSVRPERYHGRKYESKGYPYIISIYVGAPLLLLAACGAVRRPALAGLAAVAVLLSLGRHLPGFQLIYDHVPLVTMFRYPVKAQMAALLPVAMLAAIGMGHIRRVPVMVAAAAGAIGLAFLSIHAAIACAALAVAVFLRREWLIAGVVAVDLLVAGWGVNDFAPRDLLAPPRIAAIAGQAVGDGRLYSARKPPTFSVRAPTDDQMWLARADVETLDNYVATMFAIPAIYNSDYDGLAPSRMGRLVRTIDRMPWEVRKGLLDRGHARAVVAPEAVDIAGLQQVASVEFGRETIRLYANRDAVPARFVSSIVGARDEREAARLLLSSVPLSKGILENVPRSVGDCGTAPVKLLVRGINAARYEVDAPCSGYVIFAENHYDGWTATVDGIATPHVRADYVFTAVAVTKGRHVIERRYFPPRLMAGFAGVVATAVVLFAIDRRRRRRAITS